jgi:iron-sulfur cluster assembly protein
MSLNMGLVYPQPDRATEAGAVRQATTPRSKRALRVGDERPVPPHGRHVVLTMTDTAAEAVRLISAGSGLEPEPGLRISAGQPTPEGTPLEIGLAAEAEPNDETVEEGGARVYLEEIVVPALDDKVLDAAIEGDQVRFALHDAQPGSTNGSFGPG